MMFLIIGAFLIWLKYFWYLGLIIKPAKRLWLGRSKTLSKREMSRLSISSIKLLLIRLVCKARAKAEKMGIRVVGDITKTDLPGKEGSRSMREIWLHPKDVFGAYTLLIQSND